MALGLVLIGAPTGQSQTRNALPPGHVAPQKGGFTICSQNLENYGSLRAVRSRVRSMDEERLAHKEAALVVRFMRSRCDVIAVQEVLGSGYEDARRNLQRLAAILQSRSGRPVSAYVGQSNEKKVFNGFLILEDRSEVLNTLSYAPAELPKLSEEQRPRMFVRGPFEIQLKVRSLQESAASRLVSLVTFHFKSQASFGASDPAELEWETYRMEMAEALRRIVLNRHTKSFSSGENILVLLGDRNSHFNSASAEILRGSLKLEDFQGEAPCRISKRGVPLCQTETATAPVLHSVLNEDPQTRFYPGTYHYKNVYSWLDDILVPTEVLPFARVAKEVEGDYDSGVFAELPQASDHALVWVRLDWE